MRPPPAKTVPAHREPVALWKLRAGLVAIVCAAYANAFRLGAALDGSVILYALPQIRALTGSNLYTILTTDYWGGVDRLYRPLTTLSFLFNFAVLGNGTSATGYHTVNILLHAMNVLLVFGLAARWFGLRGPAFFAAALWAVHPVGADVVTNLAGRADLLAAAGLLGALTLYTRWPDGKAPPWRVTAFFGLALGAVAAKETGAMLIPLLLVSDAVEGKLGMARLKSRAPALCAAGLAAALYLAVRMWVFAALPWPPAQFIDNPLVGAGFWEARWTAVKMLGADLLLLVWPARLAADRSFDVIRPAAAGDAGAWASLAAVLALAAVAIRRRREDPPVAFGAALFALTLLPSANLIVLIGGTMAERFLYLPSIGFCFAVAALVYRAAPRPITAAMVLGALAALFAARTLARNPDWDSNLTLMAHDTAIVPRNARLHFLYGEALGAAGRAEPALAEFEKAWELVRGLAPENNIRQIPASLGRVLLYQGRARPGESRQWAERALPVLTEAHRIQKATQARFDRTQLEHGKPTAKPIGGVDVYLLLGEAYRQLGRYREALAAYREARGLAPADPLGYDTAAEVAAESGDPGEAARIELEKALSQGLTLDSIAALGPWYAKVADGGCAVAGYALNPACPRLRADLCVAIDELRRTYLDARQPNRAAEFERMSAQSGCAAR